MVDVSKLDAEELNELMEKCRARQAELKRENISSMQEEAMKNIGRCYGHLHSSAWCGGYDKFFHTQITEIDLAEFIKEWQRRIDDFTMKYVSNVIKGVNCGKQDC